MAPASAAAVAKASGLHIVLALLFVKFTLLLSSCILVLLVLRNEIVHVALSLRKFHLVHPLTRVPVQEGFAAEHGCEVLCHALKHLLDRGGVPSERYGHFETLRWDIADRSLDIVRNPLHEVRGVLVLNIEHL